MFRKSVISHRRSNMDIIADILRIAKGGARKTRIVYGANLNFKLLNEYLDKLEKAGLIARDPEMRSLLKTTEKGKKYLEHYEGFKDFGLL